MSCADAAETTPALTNPAPISGWTITLGASAEFGPDYDGAKGMRGSAMPTLSLRRASDDNFSAPDDGMDFALYETETFRIGLAGDYKAGRYSGSSNKLFGLRDLPWTIEAGAFAEFWPIEDRLRTRIEIRQGFNGHHGVVADLSADWVEQIGRFTLSAGPRMTLGSKAYMRRNFGVTPYEAAVNGLLPAYSPGGGIKSVGFTAALEYAWDDNWSTEVFARYEHLLQDAARSPLVRLIGERDQITVGIGVSYSFTIGG